MRFERAPSPSAPAREVLVDGGGGVTLSGLLAEPAGVPRALIVAIHGAGMHAGYFDAMTAPGLSLLELGSSLGFMVWAPDRPGIGASADLPDERVVLFPQAALLLDAIDAFTSEHGCGAGVFLVGHSYGLKVALTMAADERGREVLGIDGSGSGIRFALSFEGGSRTAPLAEGDRGPAWGPTDVYPPSSFERGSLPFHEMPAAQVAESSRWADDLRGFGASITAPVRFTFGEHEGYWPTDQAHFDEIRAALPNVAEFSAHIERRVGHNVSLGYAARSYHLRAIAFAEQCLLARSLA
jgi:pimeloyl-ACP methyl ester carboxylesterase